MAWGRGVELLEPSRSGLNRTVPCSARCGGCQFRHLTYAEELRGKGPAHRRRPGAGGRGPAGPAPVLGAEAPTATATRCSSPWLQAAGALR